MKLFGSLASPFVRRIRLLLHSKDYEFEIINVFSKEGRKILEKHSPTLRVPVLLDGKKVIWDSMLITEHLLKTPVSIEKKKELVLVNEMTEAGMHLFQLRKFEIDPDDSSIFSKNNLARIKQVLDYFEKRDNSDWELVSQWLFCALDWFKFRSIYSWEKDYPGLMDFYKGQLSRDDVRSTSPL